MNKCGLTLKSMLKQSHADKFKLIYIISRRHILISDLLFIHEITLPNVSLKPQSRTKRHILLFYHLTK